ncbi:hypothetical protein RI054_18g83380 [Pseudoscourfieldia marina]
MVAVSDVVLNHLSRPLIVISSSSSSSKKNLKILKKKNSSLAQEFKTFMFFFLSSLSCLCRLNGALAQSSSSLSNVPNVVVFMLDDLPHYLTTEDPSSVNGSGGGKRPGAYDLNRQLTNLLDDALSKNLIENIREVQNEAVTFTKAYTAGPKCAPSRYSLLTTRFPSNGVYAKTRTAQQIESRTLQDDGTDAKDSWDGRADVTVPNTKVTQGDETDNLAQALKANGYYTSFSGKWHMGTLNAFDDYDAQVAEVQRAGFDHVGSVLAGNLFDGTGAKGAFAQNVEFSLAGAIAGVDTAIANNKPFYVHWTPYEPNGNAEVSYRDALFNFTANHTPACPKDSPKRTAGDCPAPYIDASLGMPSRADVWNWAETNAEPTSGNRRCTSACLEADYLAGVRWIDQAFGSFVRHLKAKGVYDNTVLVVLNDHGMGSKNQLYELGSRTVLYVRYPPLTGMNKGDTNDAPVLNTDIGATVMDIIGITNGITKTDGASFKVLLERPTQGVADAPACTTYGYPHPATNPSGMEVRVLELGMDRAAISTCDGGRYKYIRRGHVDMEAITPQTQRFPHWHECEQLYDLNADAGEQTNIVGRTDVAGVLAKLRASMCEHDKATTGRVEMTCPYTALPSCGKIVVRNGGGGTSPTSPSTSPTTTTTTTTTTSAQSATPTPTQRPPGSGRPPNRDIYPISVTYSNGRFSGTVEGADGTVTIPSVTSTPAPSPVLGNVGYTTSGRNIFGPFEAGFGSEPDAVASENTRPPYPCYDGQKYYGYCPGGMDVGTCEASLFEQCGDGNVLTELFMDSCGGHASPYHYHTDIVCNYDVNAPGHSSLVGFMLDGVALYGKNEGASMLPSDLDACGGHFGLVPANSTFGIPSETVYHYHIQLEPPYLSGCFGPVNSVQECKALYTARNRGCSTIENVNMGYGATHDDDDDDSGGDDDDDDNGGGDDDDDNGGGVTRPDAEATHNDDDDDNGGGGVSTIAVAETTHDDDDNGCSGVISANDFGRREAHKLRVRVGPTSW